MFIILPERFTYVSGRVMLHVTPWTCDPFIDFQFLQVCLTECEFLGSKWENKEIKVATHGSSIAERKVMLDTAFT